MKYEYLLYKVQCFIKISGTNKTDILTCEIIMIMFNTRNKSAGISAHLLLSM